MRLSRMEFASLLAYVPQPWGEPEQQTAQQRVRDFVNASLKPCKLMQIEGQRVSAASFAVSRLSSHAGPLRSLAGQGPIAVPVPRATPSKAGSAWASIEVAEALVAAGHAAEVLPLVERRISMPKAASRRKGDRLTVADHFASLGVSPGFHFDPGAALLLVDDVISSGSTMLACRHRLLESYPSAKIVGFAVARTISEPSQFKSVVEFVTGEITEWMGRASRNP